MNIREKKETKIAGIALVCLIHDCHKSWHAFMKRLSGLLLSTAPS